MTEKKNICITINSLAPGGAEKQSLLLAKALKEYHHVTVVIINPRPIYKAHVSVIEKEDIKHLFLTKNPIKKLSDFTHFLKKNKTNIIFAFLPTDTIWASIGGKIAGVPYILGGIRNSHIAYLKFAALRFVNNYLLNYTIANNYSAHGKALEFGFKKKVFVIPNGIEMRPLHDIIKTDMNSITIISVGRLVKQKAYETALQSILELKNTLNDHFDLRYRIVGHGPQEKSIRALIEKYGLQREVELITNTSDIYPLLESSDIYLSTSIFEGISNSIMEAMNCGLPIVATDAGDNSRLVSNGINGFITNTGSYIGIAQHLGSLIKSPDLRKRMGLASHSHLNANFGYQTLQKKYLNLIENIASLQIQNGEPII